ncbi:MAG TPA: hypothetical protein PKL97_03620 [Candidatus Omnitrophota bacterium]|nr:hypothetical protein [Candidatus Omnitrophota bacterium]
MSPEEKKPGKPQKPKMEEPRVIVAGTVRAPNEGESEVSDGKDVKIPSAYKLLFEDKPEGSHKEFEPIRGFNFTYAFIVIAMIIAGVAASFFAGVFLVDRFSTFLSNESQEQGE